MKVDFVVDQDRGDCGKAKVVYSLLKKENYSIATRSGGSANCGHTFYHEGQKVVTHQVPIGVAFGVRSIIPPNCVVDVDKFFAEIKYLEGLGVKYCSNLVRVDERCHIVTKQHLEEDSTDTKIGTTRCGVGPCVRDKYARVGVQAKNVPELKGFVTNFDDEISRLGENDTVLVEGAQGFYLDPHWAEYPYCTSTHCTVAGALLNGISHKDIRTVYGLCKAYTTYVGAKRFQPEGEIFNKMAEAGHEYGSTTGRRRQCNFLNVSEIQVANRVNGVDILIINKMDVLQEIGCWKVIYKDSVLDLGSENRFKQFLLEKFNTVREIKFSYSPNEI